MSHYRISVDCMWVEINSRINHPIKLCLNKLEENGDINMSDNHIKFCVSWFTIRVTNVGVKMAIKAWNDHRIPDYCIANAFSINLFNSNGAPNDMMKRYYMAPKIDPKCTSRTI